MTSANGSFGSKTVIAAIFRSEALWLRNERMTALAAFFDISPTSLSAAVRYYRNAVETG
jgi:hypothetical protein